MRWSRSGGVLGLGCAMLVIVCGCGGPDAKAPLNQGATSGDQTTIMPLSLIWAHGIPGTNDITGLEPERDFNRLQSLSPVERAKLWKNSLLRQIEEALSVDGPTFPREGQTARPGFAVAGQGQDALESVYLVLVDGEPPREKFRPDEEVSIFFFAYESGTRVHLQRIQRRPNLIGIQYDLVQHDEKQQSVHFALIPLGKQNVGTHRVEIFLTPLDQRFADPALEAQFDKFTNHFVCHSFSFSVVNEGSK